MRLNRVAHVANRAGGAREMEYLIDMARVKCFDDVLLKDRQARMVSKRAEVDAPSSDEVVGDDNLMAVIEQAFCEVRPDESSSASYQNAHPGKVPLVLRRLGLQRRARRGSRLTWPDRA